MSKDTSRRIFFWILAVLFFTATLLVVFYALGYRFNFERGIFIYSGSITVKSNPKTVDITLDQKPIPSKKVSLLNGSYHIDGIKPGDYSLGISNPGFQSWSKKISVHSGVSTEFWNVFLAKNEYSKNDFSISCEKNFFISPKKNYAAYLQKQDSEFLVKILDFDSNESEEVFSSKNFSFINEAEKENIEWSPQSHAIILPVIENESKIKNYFIIDINSKKTINLKDISGLDNFDQVRWDPQKKNVFSFLSGRNLYQIDLENIEGKRLIAENVYSFDFGNNYLFYFQLPGGIIYKASTVSEASPEQITTSPPDDMSNDKYKIITYDENRIAFIDDDTNKLYIWNNGDKGKYFRKLSDNAAGMQFSDDGKKLLFWNSWEIFVYFTRDWDVQPSRAENELADITRFSENLQNVQWSKDYEHVIFQVGKKIKIAELDRRDYVNIMDISTLESDNVSIVSDFSNNLLYFTDKKQANNDSLSLFSIPFPEKEGILGF